jgi:hypothetical protein
VKHIVFLAGFIFYLSPVIGQDAQNLNPKSVYFKDFITSPFDGIEGRFKKLDPVAEQLDSIYFYYWNITTSEWDKTKSTLFLYDENNLLISKVIRVWNSQNFSWNERININKTYNDSDLLSEEIEQIWDSAESRWLNHYKTVYNYNPDQTIDFYIIQFWDIVNQSWANSSKYIYDFDNEANWILYLRQDWNYDNLKWINRYQLLYTFENSVKTATLRQIWDTVSATWSNDHFITHNYDMSGLLINESGQIWNSDSLRWDFSSLIEYLYNTEGQIVEKIYQIWEHNDWNKTVRYIYEYNETGRNTSIMFFLWNSSSGIWETNKKYLYDYNIDGSLTNEIWQIWDTVNGIWLNDLMIKYYLGEAVSVISPLKNNEIIFFPNPFAGKVTLKLSGIQLSEIFLQIFDIEGRIVYSLKMNENPIQLDLDTLPGGTYLLNIKAGNRVFNKKIIKK